eukprot:CAMPEP_0184365758 /NCGR_PEP_ID=MMETSP1089-20130417/150504_1 /TAXON_ID=38269 ORGANISM="Gloeochaete wittrockiana, Strain SAG46.84" /NCGR_SAMPLE_ID=MMETSP1089 /ASSEMBLY_ACC=CAM_ASM_000445 /LENGTH=53 /DNA_ID=CAMNT_0026707115 /DNA_START=145 /DNA_END=302 /DNA_ORIENTATION=-
MGLNVKFESVFVLVDDEEDCGGAADELPPKLGGDLRSDWTTSPTILPIEVEDA